MEHILQFGINIDDDMIKKTSDKLAERLIKTKAIKDMVNKAVSDLMN